MKRILPFLTVRAKGFVASLRPVFLIFRHDVRTIISSVSVIIIMAGLAFMPSLYAWINIYACWDPYSNTGNLPVAIVNKDDGAVYGGKVINVGKNVVEELKKNKSIGWDFVDEWQANYGLNEGRYYALIELPDNFTQRLITLTSSTPQKPVITYRVNEKLNSIATKITDAAETKLVQNIQTNFIKTVTTEAINTLKTESKNTDLGVTRIGEIKSTLTQAESDIVKVKQYIADANADSANFQSYMQKCSDTLPDVSNQIANLQSVVSADQSLTRSTHSMIETVSSSLTTDVQQLRVLDGLNQQMIAQLRLANGNTISADTIQIMKQCSSICASLDILLQSDAENIGSLNDIYGLNTLGLLKDSFVYADRLVVSEKAALDKQIPVLSANGSKQYVDSALQSLSGLSTTITGTATTLANRVQSDGMPVLSRLSSDIQIQLGDVGSMAELTKAFLPQLGALAAFSGAGSRITVSQANELNDRLTSIQSILNQLMQKIGNMTGENLDRLIALAENNPSKIADFLSSPITVKEVDVYGETTFGAGLTPFYTVLAIWVGALLSCALLSVQFEPHEIDGVKVNLKQKHFGKMLLFLCLSIIQAMIITLGDVFLLGVKPVDFPLMLGMAALTAVTFTVIIFTLVSLFGNVGKAIAVVMMVFQIAGAGGIYPIQTNPKIFGMLAPLWPFSYAIEYFREAIAGPVWSSVLYNVRAMCIFIGAFLLLAILKKPFHKINTAMERMYKKAQI